MKRQATQHIIVILIVIATLFVVASCTHVLNDPNRHEISETIRTVIQTTDTTIVPVSSSQSTITSVVETTTYGSSTITTGEITIEKTTSTAETTTYSTASTTSKTTTVKTSTTKTIEPTTTKTTTTTPTTTAGRPFSHKNMVDMINEERARIGNPVRVSYGNATLQKIATTRAREQDYLFGHRRPSPCHGCDYCHGEGDCIYNESFWIEATYGTQYARGSLASGVPSYMGWKSVEEFRDFVKGHPSGHYDQMFRSDWTRFAYDFSESGSYLYFNYGDF